MKKIVVIIPARLQSIRLPNKVLLDIQGKPMIQHVFENSQKASRIEEVYIATDSQKVKECCEAFTTNIILTSSEHQSGTDRLAEAITEISCDGVINVQGDEPFIDPTIIDQLAEELQEREVSMASAMHRIQTTDSLLNPNDVKVTVNQQGFALYFSRSVIPHPRDQWEDYTKTAQLLPPEPPFYKHIGIYAYTKEFLHQYSSWEQGSLERVEKLEQLRVLEKGHSIKMIETNYQPIGVDTFEDLQKVRKLAQ